MSAVHALDGRASALPLSVALSIIPSLPRPLLARLVARAIERLDEMDGDPEQEPDDFSEDDDPAEDDDPEGTQWHPRSPWGMPQVSMEQAR